MKNYKVKFDELFESQYSMIEDYLVDVLCNPYAKSHLRHELINKISQIKYFPYAFPKLDYYSNRRYFQILNYICIYSIYEDSKLIILERCYFSKQNFH